MVPCTPFLGLTDALFLDIDGTLLDIAPTPNAVVVGEALKENLLQLHAHLSGALALISGRMIGNIDDLFAPLRLPCAGAHGAQWRAHGSAPVEEAPPLPLPLRGKIHAAFDTTEGLVIEDKGSSITVHYRLAPAYEERLLAFLNDQVALETEELEILRGRKVFELVRPHGNKAAALERFMKALPFAGRRPIFIGDDVTDQVAIDYCNANGGLGLRVAKGADDAADDASGAAFASPAEVRDWLAAQALALSKNPLLFSPTNG